MDIMPCLWQQNKVTDTGRYKVKEFSPLLSEMQIGNFDKCKGTTYNRHQRARHTDAEPMNL